MFFVCIWGQTTIISLYNINWLVSVTEVLPFNVSGHYMYRQCNIQQFYFCPQSVFMCFVCIWEQPEIISLYNINW